MGFKWASNEQLHRLFTLRSELSPNDVGGIILEVDLEYPEDLHDLHNDFPLAPDKIRVEPSTFLIGALAPLG